MVKVFQNVALMCPIMEHFFFDDTVTNTATQHLITQKKASNGPKLTKRLL
jgi:hypothetical protein